MLISNIVHDEKKKSTKILLAKNSRTVITREYTYTSQTASHWDLAGSSGACFCQGCSVTLWLAEH